MKERDLIIGCYYWHKHYDYPEGEKRVVMFDAAAWYRIGDCVDMEENYSPIEITKTNGVLEGLGFKWNGYTYSVGALCVVNASLNNIKIYNPHTEDDVVYDMPKHVHELQNMLYVLVKLELVLNAAELVDKK